MYWAHSFIDVTTMPSDEAKLVFNFSDLRGSGARFSFSSSSLFSVDSPIPSWVRWWVSFERLLEADVDLGPRSMIAFAWFTRCTRCSRLVYACRYCTRWSRLVLLAVPAAPDLFFLAGPDSFFLTVLAAPDLSFSLYSLLQTCSFLLVQTCSFSLYSLLQTCPSRCTRCSRLVLSCWSRLVCSHCTRCSVLFLPVNIVRSKIWWCCSSQLWRHWVNNSSFSAVYVPISARSSGV